MVFKAKTEIKIFFSDYGMVENVLNLTFKDLKTKQKFSEKLLEARNLYKNLQNGISAGSELMKDIDKLELSAERFDSDPETPDECILSSAKNIHENIPGKCFKNYYTN